MRALVLTGVLAGCVASAPTGPLPLRNPTAPVASQVDASLTRLNGDWVVVQGQGVAPGTRVRFGAATVAVGSEVQSLAPLGQGRFMLGSDEVWIYWLDADNRTAALGDPGGRRVWIMDRKGEAGERLRAAREILTWYGYDMTRLEGA